jgi:hypothetical protein
LGNLVPIASRFWISQSPRFGWWPSCSNLRKFIYMVWLSTWFVWLSNWMMTQTWFEENRSFVDQFPMKTPPFRWGFLSHIDTGGECPVIVPLYPYSYSNNMLR